MIIKDGKVLLLKKEDDTGTLWDMPGGRVDEGEWDMKAALKREVEEELPGATNIQVGEEVHHARFPRNLEDGTAYYLFFFPVQVDFEGDDLSVNEEHLDYCWFNLDEVKNLPNNESESGYLYDCYREVINVVGNQHK